MSGAKGVGATDTPVCTVSWCVGGCAGRDHMSNVDTVTCTGHPRRLEDLRVAAGTLSAYNAAAVSLVSADDSWTTELTVLEARELAGVLMRHADTLSAEPGTR